LVDPTTATLKTIPIADLDPSVPTWSRDGRWVYFHSGNTALSGIYKVTPEGGAPVRISKTEGWHALESSDGKRLYFVSPADGELWVRSIITGEEHTVRGIPRLRAPNEWVLASSGIYFIDRTHTATSIAFFDFTAAKVTRRISLEKEPSLWGGLALSPDGTWLAYSQIDQRTSDLMLVEGFR
jgi:Tol biopolymer transport system component